MAVEIVNNGKKTHLDVFYHFVQKEELKMTSPTHYGFDRDTGAKIRFLDKVFIPQNIYVTQKIHKAGTLDSDCELILESEFEAKQKLFMCIGLRFQTVIENNEWVFPLKTANLEDIVSQCRKNYVYQTKSGNFVCVCTKSLLVNGVKPAMSVSPKDAYKDIIDGDSYDVLSLVMTGGDNHMKKVESKSSNVVFKKMLFDMTLDTDSKQVSNDDVKEGFNTAMDNSYMECKLLKEDTDDMHDVYEDVAVVPLKTNVYERGIVTFSHFVHFCMMTIVAGIGFPLLFSILFKNGIGENMKTFLNFFLSIFILIGVVFIGVGLGIGSPKENNTKKKATATAFAIIGFYLLIMSFSFALGMYAFKKLNNEIFKFNNNGTDVVMFNIDNLSWRSLFNILDGLVNEAVDNRAVDNGAG